MWLLYIEQNDSFMFIENSPFQTTVSYYGAGAAGCPAAPWASYVKQSLQPASDFAHPAGYGGPGQSVEATDFAFRHTVRFEGNDIPFFICQHGRRSGPKQRRRMILFVAVRIGSEI